MLFFAFGIWYDIFIDKSPISTQRQGCTMYECPYPHLFTPIVLAGQPFRNRIFASPTGLQYNHYGNRPNNETICYFERKAIGGAASVCIGDAMVDSEIALANGAHILLDDPTSRAHLSKLASTIQRHGAVASMELSHGGSSARISYAQGHRIYGPVEMDSEGSFGQPIHAYAMDEAIIERTIRKFADAAAYAKRCGFGMVTVHGGHGWLLHQFMSPITNTRTDEWGGSFEKRMRFPLAVIAAIREAVGRAFPIEIRLSGSEIFPGGWDVEYGVRIAQALDGKVDLLHISAGSHEVPEVFTVTHPSMFLDDGVNVKYAAEIKRHVNTPVATVGALSDPAALEEIIASGKADVVELARGLICDPDLPRKAREGRGEDVTKCMRCFTCFSGLMAHGQMRCALNPEIGSEFEVKFAVPPAERKTVLVAGGGVGGMQAALTAAERGHRVILCEKSDQLGGVLLCEEKVPFKRHLGEYLAQQAQRVQRAGVELRLGCAVTPELACSIAPDVIVAALGAHAATPPIPGIDGANVAAAETVYRAPETAGARLVILGGGLVGCELAIFMAGLGLAVTLLEMAPELNFGGNHLHGKAIGLELQRLNVDVHLRTKVTSISPAGVTAVFEGAEQFFPADTVVTALGMVPRRDEAAALALCAPEYYVLGDCVVPATIYQATNAAYFAALDIGKKI